jgi:hypothetical protein
MGSTSTAWGHSLLPANRRPESSHLEGSKAPILMLHHTYFFHFSPTMQMGHCLGLLLLGASLASRQISGLSNKEADRCMW